MLLLRLERRVWKGRSGLGIEGGCKCECTMDRLRDGGWPMKGRMTKFREANLKLKRSVAHIPRFPSILTRWKSFSAPLNTTNAKKNKKKSKRVSNRRRSMNADYKDYQATMKWWHVLTWMSPKLNPTMFYVVANVCNRWATGLVDCFGWIEVVYLLI